MIIFFYNSANFELQRILISEIETQVDIFLWECNSIMSRNETDLVKDKTNKTHLRKMTFLQRKYPWELLTKLKLRLVGWLLSISSHIINPNFVPNEVIQGK